MGHNVDVKYMKFLRNKEMILGEIITYTYYIKAHIEYNQFLFLGTEGVYIAERLFSSSLVAIVTHSAPRKLKVCHFKKGTEICNYSYTSKILAVKMNRAVSTIGNISIEYRNNEKL